jgi:hypothetical protein
VSQPLAGVKLPSGHIQLFIGSMMSGGVTVWQTGNSWTTTAQSPFPLSTESSDFSCIAACQHQNGSPQVWGVLGDSPRTLNTRYKLHGSTSWTEGEAFSRQPTITPGHPVNAIVAGLSASGKIQLFAAVPNPAAGNSTLMTCWQTTPNTQSFCAWESMAGAPALDLTNPIICVYNLADGRLQLWANSSSQELFTCWKESTEPASPWTAWAQVGGVGVWYSLVGGVRGDQYIQLLVPGPGTPVGPPGYLKAQMPLSPSATMPDWVNEVDTTFPSTAVTWVYSFAFVPIGNSDTQLIALTNGPGMNPCLFSQGGQPNMPWVQIPLANPEP